MPTLHKYILSLPVKDQEEFIKKIAHTLKEALLCISTKSTEVATLYTCCDYESIKLVMVDSANLDMLSEVKEVDVDKTMEQWIKDCKSLENDTYKEQPPGTTWTVYLPYTTIAMGCSVKHW